MQPFGDKLLLWNEILFTFSVQSKLFPFPELFPVCFLSSYDGTWNCVKNNWIWIKNWLNKFWSHSEHHCICILYNRITWHHSETCHRLNKEEGLQNCICVILYKGCTWKHTHSWSFPWSALLPKWMTKCLIATTYFSVGCRGRKNVTHFSIQEWFCNYFGILRLE